MEHNRNITAARKRDSAILGCGCVQPLHFAIKACPKRHTFLAQHVGSALKTILFVHRIKWIFPRKCLGCFEPGERGFQFRANSDEHIFGYAVALGVVLGEQISLCVRHAAIIFVRNHLGNCRACDCG